MKTTIKINIRCAVVIVAAAFTLCSCKKILEIDNPIDKLVTSSIFKDSTTAQAAVNGIYSQLYNGQGTGTSFYSYHVSLLPAKSADEIVPVQNTFDNFYNNSLVTNDPDVDGIWGDSYNVIYLANSVIEGVQGSGALSASLKKQLTAESKFIRAFCNFYLVNYFGNVPLITTSNITVTNTAPASTVDQVYTQIITDLIDARDALPKNYDWSGGDRTRVNSYVASAMLARVYLYRGQWALAAAEATKVIEQSGTYTLDTDLNQVFLANSSEAIWQFYTNVYGFTYFAQQTIPTGLAVPTYALNEDLYNAFETGDNRKSKWVSKISVFGTTYTYPYKYKEAKVNTGTEYEMVMRLAEQYLIRAEARAQLSDLEDATSDLNVIRNRAGLKATNAADKSSLLTAIAHERQVELFCEWGHRWLDLKRTGTANAVLGAEKPTHWQATDVLYPIPQEAINTNPKLVQNPGYH